MLIYDAANSEISLEYLKPWNPEILHVRKEQINMRVLLKVFFKKGSVVDAYIDCFIEKVRPHLIITSVDNNTSFYKIHGRHSDIKTLFVQNGYRSYYLDLFGDLDNIDSDTISTFFVDYMLVFGSIISKRYSQYLKGSFLLTGSIKNNFAPKENSSQPGVIAYISMWRVKNAEEGCLKVTHHPKYRFVSFEDCWVRPDALIIPFLTHYARKNDKRLMIIPNTRFPEDLLRKKYDDELLVSQKELQREKDYFRKLMGIEPEFSETSGPYSSYKAVDSAEIVVSIDSTLAYESVARYKKTAHFPIRSTLLEMSDRVYGWPADYPDEGPFWTNQPDPDIFIRILDYLFEVSDEQWKKDVEATNFSSLMEYDPGNTIFKSILEKELGPPPTSAH